MEKSSGGTRVKYNVCRRKKEVVLGSAMAVAKEGVSDVVFVIGGVRVVVFVVV